MLKAGDTAEVYFHLGGRGRLPPQTGLATTRSLLNLGFYFSIPSQRIKSDTIDLKEEET